MGERLLGMQKVAGSIPVVSTNFNGAVAQLGEHSACTREVLAVRTRPAPPFFKLAKLCSFEVFVDGRFRFFKRAEGPASSERH
jgi:hypothetical protein